jgi:HEAT repeat protein
MSDERLTGPERKMSDSKAEPIEGRPLQTGVRTLIVLVASCGVIFWAARYVWEIQHPAYGMARGLQAHSPSERVNATRLMEQVGMGDSAVAIPPLIAALRDAEPEVRVAACQALGPLVADAVLAGTSADAARTAVTAMTGLLEDPKPQVRIAVAEALSGITSLQGSARAMDLERVFVTVSGRLGDQDADVRIAALHALGSTARKVTHSPPAALRANLADKSAAVRAAALKALVSFQRDLDRWIPRIFEVIEREEGAGARAALSHAVSQIRPPAFSAAALPALVKGLDSHHSEIRIRACWLIGELGHDAGPAIPSLMKCMSYPIDTAMFGSGMARPITWDQELAAALVLVKISTRKMTARP